MSKLLECTNAVEFTQWAIVNEFREDIFKAPNLYDVVDMETEHTMHAPATVIDAWIVHNMNWLIHHIHITANDEFSIRFQIAGYYWYYTFSEQGYSAIRAALRLL